MEYAPQPLFKQGVSARVKVVLCTLAALALLAVDSQVHSLGFIRPIIGTALYPLQRMMLLPRDVAHEMTGYFSSLSKLEAENQRFQYQKTIQAQQVQRTQQLVEENAQLRKLLGLRTHGSVKSLAGEILYDTHDPFTRKIILNQGAQAGVGLGQPVIDDLGVVGQVTRVFPLTAEITLLTDKDQAIFVQNVRNGLRSVVHGRGRSGLLELRFMAANSDIKVGDSLVTSGIDGVYPAGLSVATVVQVSNGSSGLFGHVMAQPVAGIDQHKQLLILLTEPKIVTTSIMEEIKKTERIHQRKVSR